MLPTTLFYNHLFTAEYSHIDFALHLSPETAFNSNKHLGLACHLIRASELSALNIVMLFAEFVTIGHPLLFESPGSSDP